MNTDQIIRDHLVSKLAEALSPATLRAVLNDLHAHHQADPNDWNGVDVDALRTIGSLPTLSAGEFKTLSADEVECLNGIIGPVSVLVDQARAILNVARQRHLDASVAQMRLPRDQFSELFGIDPPDRA